MNEILPEVFYFEKWLTENDYGYLKDIADDHVDKLYTPHLKSGHSMNLQMTTFGKHWSALDYKYHLTRVDVDNKSVDEMPRYLEELAGKFSLHCFPYHNPTWDICIVNRYTPKSTLGMHQDNSETQASLEIGHPVVSFSLGSTCNFRIGGLTRNDKYLDLELKDGDVLVFGGQSRLRYHGVTRVYKDSFDFRTNFTLRKY